MCGKKQPVYTSNYRARVSWGVHPEVIRTIYIAAVEPIITYAASVWAPAAKKLGVQRALNEVLIARYHSTRL